MLEMLLNRKAESKAFTPTDTNISSTAIPDVELHKKRRKRKTARLITD